MAKSKLEKVKMKMNVKKQARIIIILACFLKIYDIITL